MSARKFFFTLILALTLAVFSWGFDQAGAQTRAPEDRQMTPESTITDAAGRVHNVMPMRRTTPEERKAASKRLKATLDAQAAQQSQGAPASAEGGAQ